MYEDLTLTQAEAIEKKDKEFETDVQRFATGPLAEDAATLMDLATAGIDQTTILQSLLPKDPLAVEIASATAGEVDSRMKSSRGRPPSSLNKPRFVLPTIRLPDHMQSYFKSDQ